MYHWKFLRRLTLLYVISVSDVRHFPALLAKNFQRRPPIFLHFFGIAPSDLQLCFVQLKTLAPSTRYSTFKYPVTLKPGLGVTQGHRKLYHPIRHPWFPINVPYGLSRTVSEINGNVRLKSPIFPPPVYLTPPMKGFPVEFGICVRGPKCLNDGSTRWSKRFSDRFSRFDTIPAVTDSQPASQPATLP